MIISDKIRKISRQAQADCAGRFSEIDETAQINTEKVLSAFKAHRVSEGCFYGSTGYGYNDKGRDTLDRVFADIFSMPSAIVRSGFGSGTHAITAALFGALSRGQTLLSATGLPYDTLQGVIGITGNHRGSLRDLGVNYTQVELLEDGSPDIEEITKAAKETAAGTVLIQRSCGYSARRALSVSEIGRIAEAVHGVNKDLTVFTDNCYGEFTETLEPGDAGADLTAGSLIKNPGGGIAPAGGYVAGRGDLVEAAAFRLTAPGIGGEIGATLGVNRLLYQGLFLAPHTVAQAMKTAVFCARLFELLGYETAPGYLESRSDIVQRIELGSPERLLRFCKGIQEGSPVDSFVTPVGGEMPGYDCEVVMAAGTFIGGSSIEQSADAPLRQPYSVFVQGGLTYESGKHGIMLAASYIEGDI